MANIQFQFYKDCPKKLPFSKSTEIVKMSENTTEPPILLRSQDTDNTSGMCYAETYFIYQEEWFKPQCYQILKM